MDTQALALTCLCVDGNTQARVMIESARVTDYAEAMTQGALFPPLDVFTDGVTYWLADGFHRYYALQRLQRVAATVRLHGGTQRDAVLFAVGANHSHGLQRTTADKRKAVDMLMSDPEWGQWSNAEIARRCGVDSSMVDRWRQRQLPPGGSTPSPPRRFLKLGTASVMQVEHIGHRGTARTAAQRAARLAQMREMAAQGHTSRQIAQACGIEETGMRRRLREHGIQVPADAALGNAHRHDPNRIVRTIVMDAENLTADVALIDFRRLDHAHLADWIASLTASRTALGAFITRLIKEQSHGEAA